MKHTPPKKPMFGAPPEKAGMLNKSERNRLIFMGVLLVGLTIAFGASLLQKNKYEHAQNDELAKGVPKVEQPDEVIAVRRFDPATIAGEVRDATPEERVLIDLGPLAKMLDHVAGYGPGQWKGLKPAKLDTERFEQILADPAAHRAEPVWLRGRLTAYEERPVGDRVAWYGTMESEDGVPVTFMTSSFDKKLFAAVEEELTYAKLEALFLEVYRREEADGWVETPLLVGSRLQKSYPRMDGFDDEALGTLLAAVVDDTNNLYTGIDDAAFLAQWMLMDRIEQGWGKDIAWDDPQVARKLDNTTFTWLMDPTNTDAARGCPSCSTSARTSDPARRTPARTPRASTS